MNNSDFNSQMAKLEDSAKSGDARAALALGNHFHDLGDFQSSFFWYCHALEQEGANPITYFYLGYAYQYGEGTAIDRMQALVMYQKAAEFDVPQALYSLAYFYQNGIVVPRDESMAQGYMKQATRKMDALYISQFDTREETANLRVQVLTGKTIVDELQQRNEALAMENGNLSQQLDQVNEEIARGLETHNKQSKEYERQILEWKQKIHLMETQQTRIEVRNQTLNVQIQKMTEQQNALWMEVDARGRNIQEKTENIENLQQHLSGVKLELTQARNELEQVKNDVVKLSKTVFRLIHWSDMNLHAEYAYQSVSIFEKYTFSLDGIVCVSLESFLQALKFKDSQIQLSVCSMPPQEARKYGRRKKRWRRNGKLWWNGSLINRAGPEYQILLDRVFCELCKNTAFTDALQNCGDLEILKGTAVSPIPLTEEEFVSRMVKMRSVSRKKQ